MLDVIFYILPIVPGCHDLHGSSVVAPFYLYSVYPAVFKLVIYSWQFFGQNSTSLLYMPYDFTTQYFFFFVLTDR